MKFLKFRLVIILITIFAGNPAACMSHAATQSPVIRVGSEVEFPPFAIVDKNGQASGFSIDLIKAVADAMGLSIMITTGSWDTVWNNLISGELDVLPIVAVLPDRKRLIDFSLPHTETFDAFFVRDGKPEIRSIDAAWGKSIVVMKSDAAHHALSERNFQGRLILAETIPEGLSMISSGKYDAFLCSKLIGTMAIQKHGIKGLIAGSIIHDYKREFAFGVKKGADELREKLNQGLSIVKSNGEYERIYRKWLSFDDPWLRYRKYLFNAFFVVIAIGLTATLWSMMLRMRVNRRTDELAAINESLKQEVAARRQAEEELLNHREKLELLIEERTRALRESEERFRHLFVNIPSGVAVYEAADNGEDFIFKDLNTAGERIEHIRKQDIIGKRVSEVFPGVKNFGIFEVFQRVWRSGQPEYFPDALYRNGRDSGTWRENWVYKLPNGEIVAIYNDITERKHAEKLLQVSLEKYKVLFGSFPVGVSVTDAHGNLIEVNRESERLLGVSVTEHNRRKIDGQEWKIIRADGTPMSADEYASVRALKSRQLVENVEMGIVRENREITWINVHAAPIPIEGYGVVITYHNITDRKRAEDDLKKNEEQYRMFFESIGYGVIYQSGDGKITDVNPAAERILGLKADQMKGKTFSEFVWRIIREDGSDFASDEYPSAISLKIGREVRDVIVGIFSVSKADMTWVRVSAVPQFRTGENTPWQVYSIFEDITDKKLAENSRKWEIKSLRQYSEPRKSVITSEYLGVKPLRTALADMFEEFVGKYEEWMELAIEKELFKVDNDISVLMQTMAERLGFFNAGPRDLVDIHVKALQHKTEKLSSRKAQIYADAGRMMLLELMGYLLSFYRNRCVGNTTIRGSSNGKKA